MNEFENALIKYLGIENFKKVQSVKIGIAGCGGLGSNCAFNLVRSGFKNFVIVDFDKIEISNLNRQFYFSDQIGLKKVDALKSNLVKINPDINIDLHCLKLEPSNIIDIFNDCHVVVEAFDKAEAKSMLIEKLLPTKKFIVSGSGLAGFGNSDNIKVNRIKENLIIIGDLSSEATEVLPPLSPRVNIAAAKQADVVLTHILDPL